VRGSLKEWGGEGSGKWRVRVHAGRDGRGRATYVSRNFTGSRRQAETFLSKLVADVDRRTVKSHAGTVATLLEAWLADIEPGRSSYTMREHRRSVERDINPSLGALRLDRLTAEHLDRFYASLRARGLSPASVRRHHAILSSALRRAVKWGWLAANPADAASPPGVTRSTATAPDPASVQLLLAAAADVDSILTATIALAAITGARRGELCALRWSDVDWSKQTLTIARSLTMIRRVATEGPTKTHQRRVIAIDGALSALLSKRAEEQQAIASAVATALGPDPFVLSRSPDGMQPFRPDALTATYARLAKRVGVGGHLHQLRHFAATTAIAAGVDVGTVAGRLGHADPSTTLRIYAHAVEARDRELADLLGSTVLGPVSAPTGSPS
jgi:integrase